ncbi:MAG: hypothetical protein AAF065_11910 [Verrucomicrobiota bacterium]
MNLSTAVPFDIAVNRLDAKTVVGSNLRTRQWDAVPAAIRDRAFFSAGVENVRVLEEMKRRIASDMVLDPDVAFEGKSAFVADIRRTLGASGDSGRLTDLGSTRRLELIYDMQTVEATEFGRHEMHQTTALLDAFPARELYREAAREVPRKWRKRWSDNKGKFYGGRMIAKINDPIWTAISRFSRPYSPFDFGSGMGTRDIERDEAERLGVIAPEETIEPKSQAFNAELLAGAKDYLASDAARAMLNQAFGDQIFFKKGKAVWAGDKLMDLLDDAIAKGPNAKGSFRFGAATGAAMNKAAVNELQSGIDGKSLVVDTSHLWHAMDRHGPRNLIREGSGETLAGQIPLGREEFANLNSLWMVPDRVVQEGGEGILFQRSVRGGILEMVLAPNRENAAVLHPVSIRKKKRGAERS